MSIISFANLKFKGLSRELLLSDDNFMKIVVTMNAELIVKANTNKKLYNIVNLNYATFDGRIPDVLARLKNRHIDFEKISGSDFIYDVCAHAAKAGKKVFLLGGYESSNQKAIHTLREKYGVDVDGFSPPYAAYPFPESHNELILSKIDEFLPDYLFVGFGALKQELWIADHRERLERAGVRIAVGSGGTFEFVSGDITRAPRLLQKIGFEGVFRLLQEPKLFRLRRLFYSLRLFFYA